MDLTSETIDGVMVVTVHPETLDAETSGVFKEKMMAMLSGGPDRVVLDIGEVEFIDSSGCGAILSCLRRLTERGGDMKLCNARKPVRVMLELVRMHRIMDVAENREEALASFRQ